MLNFRRSSSRRTASHTFRGAIAPLAALTLLSPLALAGCGSDSADNAGQGGSNGASSAGGNGANVSNGADGQGSTPQASAKRNPFFIIEADGDIKASPKPSTCSEAVLGGYKKVLAAPQDYAQDAQNVRELPAGNRTYEYAMTDTNGDGCAEMLLVKRFYEFSAVVVVTVDGNGNPHATRDYIVDGAGSSGGGRQFVYASNDGNGVHEFSGQSIDPTWKFTTYVPAGDKLNKTSEEKIPTSSIQSRATAIDWINTSDASGLTRMQGGTGGGGASAGGGTDSVADSGAGDTGGGALSAGQYQVTGTVKLVRAQDFVDSKPQMNGRFPNGTCGGTLNSTCDDPNDVYPILVVEGSPELKARASGSGNKMTSVTANEVDLGFNRADRSSSKWAQYDGKRVRVTVNSDDSKIPSDPTMPTVRVRLGVVSVDVL